MIIALHSNAVAMPKASDGIKAIKLAFDQNMVCRIGMLGF